MGGVGSILSRAKAKLNFTATDAEAAAGVAEPRRTLGLKDRALYFRPLHREASSCRSLSTYNSWSAPSEAMCPICRNKDASLVLCRATLGSAAEHALVECSNCGVRYLSPLPTLEELQSFYCASYYGKDWYKQQGWGAAFARAVLRHRPAGKFLDVGCGLGYFIDGVRQQSAWEVYGVEFSASAVAFARQELGLEAHQGELSDAKFPSAYFDYIQIRNVLEHVTDPMALLKECRRVLKDSGTLQLCVPNGLVDSLDLISFYRSEDKPALSKSGHLFFFPKRTLLQMFAEVGLKLEMSHTFGIRKGLASMGFWPRLKDWKRHYVAKDHKAAEENAKIVLANKKWRPDVYYTYRLRRMNARMLPGMRKFGLDFELFLKRAEG